MSFTVLVVEDDLDSRDALTMLLKLEGFNTISAADGIAALALAQTHNPNLIITDICMPGLNGIELTRRLHLQEKFRDLPIIAITAAAERTQQLALNMGAVACLTKPIDILALLDLMNKLLPQPAIVTSKIA
jgi:CheY-like chemotaxis protein